MSGPPPPIRTATSARLDSLIEERAEARRRAARVAPCDSHPCRARAVWSVVATVDRTEHARRFCGAHYNATAALLRDLGVPFVSRVD